MELSNENSLLAVADRGNATDRIRQRVRKLEAAKVELTPVQMSENQIINRDVRQFNHDLSNIAEGHAYSDYELFDGHILRVRA